MTEQEQKVIVDVLAAIFHLRHAEATRGTASYKSQFIRSVFLLYIAPLALAQIGAVFYKNTKQWFLITKKSLHQMYDRKGILKNRVYY